MIDSQKLHYLGHRKRLRDKFFKNAALEDYELLELLLFQGNPRRDVKPLAKQLLSHFGSLGRIISASSQQLEEFNLNPASRLTLQLLYRLHLRLIEDFGMRRHEQLQTMDEILQFCQHKLAPLMEEVVYVIYLDTQNGIIRHDLLQQGTINKVMLYPREIIKVALNCGANGLILAHNHPGGDPTPSFNDLKLTHELQAICKSVDIKLIDHIIVGHTHVLSLRQMGKL